MRAIAPRTLFSLAIALFIGPASCKRDNPPSLAKKTTAATKPVNYASWMEADLGLLHDRTLKQITLPASHDSAMYEPGFPQSLARTQNLSIYEQLCAGIRYFDLRPECRNGRLRMQHGPVTGPPFERIIDDVHRFVKQGHRELVILKFSHYQDFSRANYNDAVRQIHQSLGPWLYTLLPAGKRLADVTVGEYLKSSGIVLVLFDGQFEITDPAPGIWVYRDWDSRDPQAGDLRVFDQYSNTVSYAGMKSDQLQKFEQYDGLCKQRRDVPCDLFLLSWTLTPVTNVPEIAKVPNENLLRIAEGLKPNSQGKIVNVFYTDIADQTVTQAAIETNRMR